MHFTEDMPLYDSIKSENEKRAVLEYQYEHVLEDLSVHFARLFFLLLY